MTILAPQAGILGPYGPDAPQPVPVGATTVNTTNPNPFAVNVTPTNTVSNATITSVSVNNTQVATVGGTVVLVPAGGTIKCTYASGTLSYPIAAGNPQAVPVMTGYYPFTDPVFTQYTAQQNLTQPGVNASGTYT
jgi:hypothetical protein